MSEKSKLYPAVSLNEAIEFTAKASTIQPNKPIAYAEMAKAYNVKSVDTKSLKYRISSAKQFGLITTSSSSLQITDLGRKILFPKDNDECEIAKRNCFQLPDLYQNLIKVYENKALPPQSSLENILTRDYGITQNSKKAAANIFFKTASEVGAIEAGILVINNSPNKPDERDIPEQNECLENIKPLNSKSPDNNVPIPISEEATNYEPLIVPLGNMRKAILYMPVNATEDDATYVKDMIAIMFKRLYNVTI